MLEDRSRLQQEENLCRAFQLWCPQIFFPKESCDRKIALGKKQVKNFPTARKSRK